MRKIKIIHIMNGLEIGGLENGVVNLVNNMDSNLFDFSICCIRKEGPLKNRLRNGIKVLCLHEKKGFNYFRPLKMVRIFKKEKPDIVHTHGWAGGFLSGVIGARLAGVPAVINGEHGVMYVDHKRRLIAQKILAALTSKIITVSYSIKNALINKLNIDRKKIELIINGVDTQKFRPKPDVGKIKRNELGISENTLIVGTVGRLAAVKDYATLLHAARKVIKKISNAKFVFVGEGPLGEDLKDLSRILSIENNVVFLGEREDVPGLLNMLDMFTLTSISEGLSNTILEAMATAKPVIATNVGDNARLVEEEKTGYLVPSENPELLADKIINLANNKTLMKKMGVAARWRAEKEFSLTKMVKSYEDSYKKLVNNKKYLIVTDLNMKRLDSMVDMVFHTLEKASMKNIYIEYVLPVQPCNSVKEKLKRVGFSYTVLNNWWNKKGLHGRNNFRIAFKIWKIIKAKKFDLVEFNFCSEVTAIIITILLKLSRLRTVLVWRQHRNISYPISWAQRHLSKLKLLSWVFDLICPVFEGQKKVLLSRGIPQDKLRVIYSAIDLKKYESLIAEKQSLKVPERAKKEHVITTVASLIPRKGLSYLLRAAALILEKVSNVKFMIVGEGPSRRNLEELANELKITSNVVFTSKRNDVPQLLMTSDIFALPALSEAMPLSILEAMASARPVIASNVGGIPDIIIDGENGFLVPPKDCNALAKAILRLLENKNLARKMGLKGRKIIKNKFCMDKMVDRYFNTYEDLTNKC